jgi:hypothetical protein
MIDGVVVPEYHRDEIHVPPGPYSQEGAFYSGRTRNAEMPGGKVNRKRSTVKR